MKSQKLVALVAFASLAVGACGGSGTAATGGLTPTSAAAGATATPGAVATTTNPNPNPSAAAVDLCTLFTSADLMTAFGTAYGAGVPDSVGQCTWRAGGAAANNGDGQLVASITQATIDTIKSTFPGGTDVTVSGHAAYWNGGQGLQSLWVDLGGGRLLTLTFDPVDAGTQAIAQQLAEIAVPKL